MDFLILTVLVLCGSTVALAGEHCSYEDAAIVIRDWNHVYESGDRSAVLMRFSDVITEKFFEMDPTSFPLFTSVNAAGLFSGEFYAFRVRIYITLTELINKLHSPEVLDSMLDHLANQHAAIPDITQEHFRVFRKIVKSTLRQFLDEYNPDAWDNCMFGIFERIATKLP